ncbi:MAG: hypothetical protein BMS9Abin02_2082 [Anaerolineae bacterium]|nr:MAG: hypothetical protein BMS9Abin02_2082 [Anaerolineae bacterium]
MSEPYATSQISRRGESLDYISLAKRLGNVEHFRRLSLSDREAVVTAGQIEHFPAETVIFREGGPCAGLFVLFQGQVNLGTFGLHGLAGCRRSQETRCSTACQGGGPSGSRPEPCPDLPAWG